MLGKIGATPGFGALHARADVFDGYFFRHVAQSIAKDVWSQ